MDNLGFQLDCNQTELKFKVIGIPVRDFLKIICSMKTRPECGSTFWWEPR